MGMPSLTGSFFLDGVVVVTVGVFVAVVVTWPRLGGRNPLRFLTRVLLLLLVNLLVLLTAATQLNSAFLFFADWSDLQGSITGHVAQTHLDRGGVAVKAVHRQVTGVRAHVAAPVPPLRVPVTRSGVASFTVHGRHSGLTGQVVVQLPAGYSAPGSVHQRYPVLEAFHGYPSQPLNWVKVFQLGQAVEQQVVAGTMGPTLVVMPQIEFPGGVDTEGVDGTRGRPQVETWLTRDVPDFVAHTFRVRADRSSWATIGYSAGGWDAAMSTVLHPAQYAAGIVLGGYFRPEFGPFYEPYAASSPLSRRYDLPAVVAHTPPPVALWVETSHADAVSYTSSADFLHHLRNPTAVHTVVLQNAGHRDSVWIALLPQALAWLGTHVAGFHP
ncbi:MAG: putative esterase [Marmoricola sp.]|nr:putative esterase [Marmoricola sp.]